MEQQSGDNSNSYQARRDINIHGMDYMNVKQLCLDLIHENFPKLQEKAMEQVTNNVMDLAEQLRVEIDKRKHLIDPEKLGNPDVQASVNEAVQGAAKKGRKCDLNLLANLVAARIDKGNSDLLDITIEEAISITPKLTRAHLHFLSVKHFIAAMTLQKPNVSYMDLEQFSIPVLQLFGAECNISVPNIQYLAGVGVLDFNPMFGHDPIDSFVNRYQGLAKDSAQFKEEIKTKAPSLNRLLEIYTKERFDAANLNSFGQVIALTNLGKVFGNMDLKIWIN
ncbi:LPO_1073/Vpar_1526 family protein [Photobacterium leiognathi]|uniref:LPO_1073/Vpar_1526 family protein n=1 Tax=Photobacterium leiognathi TaxID=553611 RepID=UPI00298140A5|nr:LPO_1073/Vpar_1526 family protein [Photobacterium leiognathi]